MTLIGPIQQLCIVPVTLTEACAYVAAHHRHHDAPIGGLFAVGVAPVSADYIVAVAIIGRPVARMLQIDDYTAEVTRVCTDGTQNACSMLYGTAWRAARAMGYRRLITYTLPSEGGASLRASGWRCVGEAGGGSWSRRARPRVDTHPTQIKLRWEAS
jgi:hypothetical protein